VAIPDPRGKPQSSVNNWAPGFLPAAYQGVDFNSTHPVRNLARPASIPAAADQEDFVSMGLTTMQKAQQILDNCFGVCAIEMMAAAQALDLRGDEPAAGTGAARAVIRKLVSHLDEDRPLYRDHNRLVPLLRSPDITSAVEAAVGKLA